MAFAPRNVEYKATVNGFDRAKAAIEGVDEAAEKAAEGAERVADEVAGAGNAAAGAAPKIKQAGDSAKRAGDQAKQSAAGVKAFEEGVGKLNKILTGFGLLSIPGAITALIDLGTKIWEWTDAGKAAQAATEAHNNALQATVDLLTGVSDASKVATRDLVAYYRVRKAAEAIETELNELLDERLKLDGKLRNARLGGDVNAQKKYSAAIEDTDRKLTRLKDRLSEVTAEQKALTEAVEDAGAAMTGQPLELLREGVKKVSDQVRAEAARIKREAEVAAKALRESLTRALDLTDAIDLDALPPLDLELVVDPKIKPLDANALTSDLLAGPDFNASFESTREALKRLAESQAEAQKAADEAASHIDKVFIDLIDGINTALEADGVAAWVAWSQAAQQAIEQIQGMLGSFRVAFDAVTESTLTARANDVTQAEDALRLAERAERIAQANLDADKESLALKGAARRASEDRLKAEEAVYQAQLRQWEAEKKAAEAQKILKGIEFALEGAKAGAKAIESFALAAFLAALPFGAGAAFVPAAITAGVTYTAAAAAYGVGAAATFAAPTPVGAKPVEPDPLAPLSESERDRTKGSGSGDKQSVTNVNVNFAGQVLATEREVQRAILQALKESEGQGGMPKPAFGQIGR